MRRSLIAAMSAMTLMGAPALAQTNDSGPTSPPTAGTLLSPPASVAIRRPMPDPMKQEDVSEIKGVSVYGRDDKKIGSIAAVLMAPETKQIDRLVVGAGGVLGLGARDVALPLDQFQWDANKGGFKVAKTADELKTMPKWVAPGSDDIASGSSAPPTTR